MKELPNNYFATGFNSNLVELQINHKDVILNPCNTAGHEYLQTFRAFLDTNADVFLVCLSVLDPSSLVNVQLKWILGLRMDVKSYGK
jgi:GTPase SAR1 family protein